MDKKPIVYLGLSGGVDSAVAAALLLEKGYDVRGIFLKIWSESTKTTQCTWVEERRDAMAVAAKLGIPIETVDFEKDYKEEVFSYFVHEYEEGRTPNPDILCNEVIKFGRFLEWALDKGADFIATGHHVRRLPESGKEERDGYHLLAGVDEKKDQSYFLSRLNQHQLRHSLFPIGNYTKEEVRKMAAEKGLDRVACKRSTRGICFVGKVDLKEFLSQYTVEQPGEIVDPSGQVIGKHDGVAFYTIGQRKGLDVPAVDSKSKPYFIVGKDAKKNQLIASDEEGKLLDNVLYCKELRWISGHVKELPLTCFARIRYSQELQEAVLSYGDAEAAQKDLLMVEFKDPQRAIAPGQFVVFYQEGEVLGSAIIS